MFMVGRLNGIRLKYDGTTMMQSRTAFKSFGTQYVKLSDLLTLAPLSPIDTSFTER